PACRARAGAKNTGQSAIFRDTTGLRPSARRERAALPGAPMARRAGGGKSAGWLAWMRASFSPVHGRVVEKPRNPPAHPEGRMPGGRAIGVSFPLGYFSFGQAKEK